MEREHSVEALKAANEDLQASLDKCHELVDELRSKLAANSNQPEISGRTIMEVPVRAAQNKQSSPD